MLRAGVSIKEYWHLTIAEIKLVLNNYKELEEQRAKELAATIYNQATMTASFIGAMMSGKSIPSISDLYPSIFKKEDLVDEEIDKRQLEIMKARLIEFTMNHNKQRR